MVGASGITRCRPNPAVFLLNQFVLREFFIFAIAPFSADALVQKLGKGFRKTVGQRFSHDRVVIVMVLLEFLDQVLEPMAGSHRKRPEVIRKSTLPRRYKIGQT